MATDVAVARRRRRTVLTPSSATLLVVSVFVAFLLRDAFAAAHTAIGWVVACSVVALLLDPLVGVVDRVLPRWASVIVVLVAVLGVVAAVAIGLASDLAASADELATTAPEAAAALEEEYALAAEIGVRDRVESFVEDLQGRVEPDAAALAETVPTYAVTGILMLFILGYGRRYVASFVEQFDVGRRFRLRTGISAAARRSQRYLLITIGHSILNGVAFWLTCLALDLPAARSLGIAVGAFTALPLIGVLVGGVPALLLAFGLEGWRTGLLVLGAVLALQLLEAVVVRPIVDARTVRVGPTVPIVVGLLGFELYGVGGAVYGIALAVVAMAALDELGDRDEAPATA